MYSGMFRSHDLFCLRSRRCLRPNQFLKLPLLILSRKGLL